MYSTGAGITVPDTWCTSCVARWRAGYVPATMSDLQPEGCNVCHTNDTRDDENGVSECQTCLLAVRVALRPLFTADNILKLHPDQLRET